MEVCKLFCLIEVYNYTVCVCFKAYSALYFDKFVNLVLKRAHQNVRKSFSGHFHLQKVCKFLLRPVITMLLDMFCPKYILIT